MAEEKEENFGVGNWDPYLKKYVKIMDSAERAEIFNKEHANDKGSGVSRDIEPSTGELLPPEEQPDTWDPYTQTWKKAGDK
jgi:hypothetical protein